MPRPLSRSPPSLAGTPHLSRVIERADRLFYADADVPSKLIGLMGTGTSSSLCGQPWTNQGDSKGAVGARRRPPLREHDHSTRLLY